MCDFQVRGGGGAFARTLIYHSLELEVSQTPSKNHQKQKNKNKMLRSLHPVALRHCGAGRYGEYPIGPIGWMV